MYAANITKKIELKGHIGSIYGMTTRFYGDFFYTVGGDGWITRWTKDGLSPDGVLVAKTETKLFAITIHPTLDILVVGDIQGHLYWIDLVSNNIISRTVAHKSSIFDILCLDDDTLLTVSGDGYITAWDFHTRLPTISLKISAQGLRCAVYDPMIKKIYIGSSDNNIYIVDRENFSISNILYKSHENSVFTMTLLSSGRLASGGRDAHLKIRAIEPPQILIDHPAHWFTINKIIKMPEVGMLATASRDKSFRLWNDVTFDPITTINVFKGGHHHSVNTMLWFGQHQILATAGDDRVIKLWQIS